MNMSDLQSRYDDAMYDYSQGEYGMALEKLNSILAEDPRHFDAQLAVAMCHYRQGDFARAITEGHRAEKLKPHEQLVHTNLSLFYMKSGDKTTAEKHGLQARIASWRENMAAPKPGEAAAPGADELQMAQPKPQNFKLPEKFPDMPWRKAGVKPPSSGSGPSQNSAGAPPPAATDPNSKS